MKEMEVTTGRAAANRFFAGLGGIALTTVIGSLGVFATYLPLKDAAYEWQWALVFLLMLGESAAIHLPSEVILPVGGWLVVRNHDLGTAGVLQLSIVAALGNTAGSTLLYFAGFHGGRPLVRRFGRYFLIHEHDLDTAIRRGGRHHYVALFVSRLLPVVRTYGGFVAGILRIPLLPFVILTFAGSFIWAAIFIAAGVGLGEHWHAIRRPAEIAGIATVIVLVLALGISSLKLRNRANQT